MSVQHAEGRALSKLAVKVDEIRLGGLQPFEHVIKPGLFANIAVGLVKKALREF